MSDRITHQALPHSLHKSKIKSKENSKTEFYYEVLLEDNFEFNQEMTSKLHPDIIFKKSDIENRELFKHFLPSVTTVDKIEENNIKSKE